MKINKKTGLIESADFFASPFFDERPKNTEPDIVVIHSISLPPGEFGSNMINDFFCGTLDKTSHPYFETLDDFEVSTHLLIDREGRLSQFVPFHKRAWHAGVSSFKGKENCNDFSIGIELEGTDDLPYEKAQYRKLLEVLNLLMKNYNIIKDRVVGHVDIAPKRKNDPGPMFDWPYLRKSLDKLTLKI